MLSSRKAWPLLLCSLIVASLAVTLPAWGQIRINASPSLVGSGARALGMGGAFIAIADDATAASWNPGGLTQLERPELSLVYSWKWLGEDFPHTPHITPYDEFDVDLDDLNYASFVYPIPWTLAGRNLVVSLNYQRKYDFDKSLDFRARGLGYASSPFTQLFNFVSWDVEYDQKGGLSTLSPAFGFELTNRLSLGMVMNIWDSDLVPGNEWETTTINRGFVNTRLRNLLNNSVSFIPAMGVSKVYEEYDDVEGINYTFGALWKPTERLSVGAVYHTAYSTDVDYTVRTRLLGGPFGADYYKSRIRIEWPAAMGVGVAYRFPNDKLTLSLDVTRRNWDSFVQIDERGGPGAPASFALAARRISPITGMPKWRSEHDATYAVRLGAEYVFVDPNKPIQKLLPSVRAGVFYDPEPASGRKDRWWGVERKGDGDPDDFYGFSLGAGVLIGNRVNIDIDYQYRWGRDVRRDLLAGAGVIERGFDTDVDQHTVYLSTVIYF